MPERDPDEVLSSFEAITSNVHRPDLQRRRRGAIGGWLAAGTAVLVLALVVGALVLNRPPSEPGGDHTFEPLPLLPTHRDMGAYPAALLTGRLVLEGDCLYVTDGNHAARQLVIWLGNLSLARLGDEVVLLGSAGNRIATLGETVEVGGGQTLLTTIALYMTSPVPEGCEGPYWIASSVELAEVQLPSATTTIDPTPVTTPSPPPPPSSIDPAVRDLSWWIDAASPVNEATTVLHILVAQGACGLELDTVGLISDPEIDYREDTVVIQTTGLYGYDPSDCGLPQPVLVPKVVVLSEPLGPRTLSDGSGGGLQIRWQLPRAGAIPLRTKRTEPFPADIPIGPGACAGIGTAVNAVLTGSAEDPRVTWLAPRQGDDDAEALWWPPGYTATFDDGLLVYDEAGRIVHRAGDGVNGACVVGRNGEISLYGEGYAVLQ